MYIWYSVKIKYSHLFIGYSSCGGIVEAIQFLMESAKDSDAEGFRLMQEWRALAKKEAKKVFNV